MRHDPLDPSLDGPTPAELVLSLSEEDRRRRVHALIAQSRYIVRLGIAEHLGRRDLVARAVLYSGGTDSGTLFHLMRDQASHAVHANTGIGIESTRQHVRDVCASWEIPLIEEHPPVSYRDLVLERGFPGPAQHWKMYQRLKERCLDQARRRLGVQRRRTRAVVFFAGRRREESRRRGAANDGAGIALHERDGSAIWVSPLANWTTLDLQTYRAMFTNVPVCQASRLVHMSGECLCGAFAKAGELDEIAEWFPDTAAHIRGLERDVEAADIPWPLNVWGWGANPEMKREGTRVARCLGEQLRNGSGLMCSSCATRYDTEEIA